MRHHNNHTLRISLMDRIKALIQERPFLAIAFALVILFLIASSGLVAVSAQTIGPNDVKIVDIHHNDQTRSIPTRAQTVGQLIDKLEIELGPKDLVEPQQNTVIDGDNFQINIYTAIPARIHDGDEVTRTLTPRRDPRLIAKEAGIELHDADLVSWKDGFEASSNTDPSVAVEITRAKTYTINLYGNVFEFKSQSDQLNTVLAEANIAPGTEDQVEPAIGSDLTSGQIISLSRFGTAVITEVEDVEFENIDTKNPEQPIGNIQITKPGQLGKKTVTYEVVFENDLEKSRTVLQEVVTEQPVAQERIVGSKVVSTLDNVELGRQIATEMGYADQFDCIYNIYTRESGWNHLAKNRSSGAYGIPQALPGSKMGPGWESDPAVQIRWGIGYMVGRYGSPCQAYNFWQANHWY